MGISLDGTGANDVLSGTATDDTLNGLAGNDFLVGLTGNDTLIGGTEADVLIGGAGNDLYFVDNAADVVTENSGQGTDEVVATVSYVLTAYVEKLDLDDTAIVLTLNGTGNALNNVITVINGSAGLDNSLAGLAGADTLTADGSDDILDGGIGADTMDGSTGDDTYFVDNTNDHIIDAGGTDTVKATATVNLSSAILIGVAIENLTLIGTSGISGTANNLNNTLTGNIVGNVLKGMDGNDSIDGGAGNDQMYGGIGNDTFFVDSTGDKIVELIGEGTDIAFSAATYKLSAEIETLTLTGVASVNGTGNASDNVINGNAGNNTLDGGLGADTLTGGGGTDVYIVDNLSDTVIGNGGGDTIKSSQTWDLSDAVHTAGAGANNLTLTGINAIDGTGNANANIITGNAAANTLDGLGGHDTYVIGSNDRVNDSGAGVGEQDTINIAFTFNLLTSTATIGGLPVAMNITGIENITLTGGSSISATGDNGANILTGNNGTNTLDGMGGDDTLTAAGGNDLLIGGTGNDTLNGGTGADRMRGGDGDDTYYVDNTSDTVTEVGGEGGDTIFSSITINLGSVIFGLQEIENITLTGAANINATGNADVNIITGNSGNNTLNGGALADSMIGGAGNDVFIVDNVGDTVTEAGGEGTDLVLSDQTYALSALQEIENLTLTGTAAIDGTGNALANLITGNIQSNTLDGLAGNDTYVIGSNDVVNDSGGDLSDTIKVAFGFNLETSTATVNGLPVVMTVTGIENITLTGSAAINATADITTVTDNILTGNSGL
ncbi:MAG: calcium-binding protein, partial [Alphaproteobacteria bacterium]